MTLRYRHLAGLFLAACSTPIPASIDTEQGLLEPSSSITYDQPGAARQEIRLLGEDLVLRAGQASATVRGAASEGSIRFRREGQNWTLDLDGGTADWDGPTLRWAGAVHELDPVRSLTLDRTGERVSNEAIPVHYRIGVVHRPVTTDSVDAQLWFDRGLASCFGFNHEEAVLCFTKASEADPDCAMAHWGLAYALSPNYNDPAPGPEPCEAGFAAIELARELLDDESELEHALVEALSTRFALPVPEDRSELDQAYARAMQDVLEQFPGDADVHALTAEAVMQLRPWGLWTPEGEAAPETPLVRSIIEPALERWPDHPALCHLYIHAMEAGPEVQLAIHAAERLEGLTPGLGHLVHMPSHAYVWTGRYEDVIRTNLAAVELDDAFADHRGQHNIYTAYRIHNYHFVAYGAMWDGQRGLALEYAGAIGEQIPAELLAEMPDLFEVFHATPYHVMVRFGMWEELLEEADPGETMPATRAVWAYSQALAHAALGQVERAEQGQEFFRELRSAVPETRFLFQNTVADVLAVADAVLEGEILYRKGEYEDAFASLRRAVVLDRQLNYDEPWGWMEPAQHALGALLTEQGRYEEALEVYREDLERYPENGWALNGLAECLAGLGHEEEAQDARERFERAWARSDVKIPGSCFCKTR